MTPREGARDGQEDAPALDPTERTGDAPGSGEARANPSGPDAGEATLAERERKLRHRAQEAEAARDALQVRVDRQDRAEVERLVAGRMHDADDLWAVAELGALRDADGQVDPALVDTALRGLLERKPHMGIVERRPNFDGGVRTGAMPKEVSFGEALRATSRGSGK